MDGRLVRRALFAFAVLLGVAYWLVRFFADEPALRWSLGLAAGAAFLAGMVVWGLDKTRDRRAFATVLGVYVGGALSSAVLPFLVASKDDVLGIVVAAVLLSPVLVPLQAWVGTGELWVVYFAPVLAAVGGVVGWFLAASSLD